MAEAPNEEKLDIKNASGKEEITLKRLKETPYEPTQDELLVNQLKLIRDGLNVEPQTVYYPCPGIDISPSSAFPKSRIIYVDTDPKAIKALVDAGYEAYQESALEYELEKKADVVLLMSPEIIPNFPSLQVDTHGLLLCNDYHDTALTMQQDGNFELLGYVSVGEKGVEYKTDAAEHLKLPKHKRNRDNLFVFKKTA